MQILKITYKFYKSHASIHNLINFKMYANLIKLVQIKKKMQT